MVIYGKGKQNQPCYHEKKCQPQYFQQILDGDKPFEVRVDEGFKKGDILILREWDHHAGQYTGRSIECQITCVFDIDDCKRFWSPEEMEVGLSVLGLRPVAHRPYDSTLDMEVEDSLMGGFGD